MPAVRISAPHGVPEPIQSSLAELRSRLHIPGEFSVAVEAEARSVIGHPRAIDRVDLSELPFLTIDPEGSMDLDQAMYMKRDGDGYVVYYAIADVAAWVAPGGPMDQESRRRGQTMYEPNNRVPLYPQLLSEDAASLLASDPPRPAHVWTLHVDHEGVNTSATVQRAWVRNHRRMSYPEVQELLDAATLATDPDLAPLLETVHLLAEVGKLREAQEQRRGGVSLPIPEQEIHADGANWTLHYRAPLPVENWNAQISLMTGMAAATIMIDHKIGLLRTLPPVEQSSLSRLRRVAAGLKINWPTEVQYPDFLRTLDPKQPRHMAMLQQCTLLFRGASYVSFVGELPQINLHHNALAANYAHATAPLRRLGDRFVLELCSDLVAGVPIPSWVETALSQLPQIMRESDRQAKAFERGVVDLVEALILTGRVGETFVGTVVEAANPRHGDSDSRILITDPAIVADVSGYAPLGQEIQVQLTTADLRTGVVKFKSI